MKISVFYDHITQAEKQTNRSLDDLLGEIKEEGIDGVEINYSQLACDKSNILSALGKAGLQISCIYEFYDWGNYGSLEQAKKTDLSCKRNRRLENFGRSRISVRAGSRFAEQLQQILRGDGFFYGEKRECPEYETGVDGAYGLCCAEGRFCDIGGF